VAPSLLAADFARLGEEVARAEQAGADVLHLDIMDGHFVPNLTIGPPLVESLRRVTSLPFDVHLMLTNPERFIEPFAKAGADHITIHAEITADVRQVLRDIRALGCSAGISLRPKTAAATLLPFLDAVDLILVMTVEPGFGGQAFMADMMPKLREYRKAIAASGRPIHLEVDGGIGPDTVGQAVAAGADLLVAGNSVFRARDGIAAAIARLRQLAVTA
jgi:ribulose-phosphate 3-epimerase